MEINYTTYEQDFRGGKRTIYTTTYRGVRYESGSLERLIEMVKNHVDINEGTFKN
jgi:hypothetical protein